MFFQVEKLKDRVRELDKYRYYNRTRLSRLTIHEDVTKQEKYPPSQRPDHAEELTANKLWEGRDRYFWIMGEIEVPAVEGDNSFVLLFDFGKSSLGNNSGFESMLYINGEPYQAVDASHKEVFIDKAFTGQTLQLALRLWGGLEGGGAAGEIWHLFKYADQAILLDAVDDFYYTSLVMLETVAILDRHDTNRITLLELLDNAYKVLDWSENGSSRFYESVEKANDQLQSDIDQLEKHSDITVTAIGHTHIDVAWLWRLKHTREKAARSFSTVFRLMEQYPEYIFLQSQPQLYEYIKEDYPELYSKIKQKVKEGRWEVEGAMWLESDANIPSGESLVRQILFGKGFMKQEFDADTKYLWLPDVFGYSWALPQILNKSGIDLFMTTKISWSQYNRMPNDTFIWKGIDGSEILTHFVTTPSTGNTDEFAAYTYNGEINPFTVQGVYNSYKDKDLNKNLLISYGYGDGGGGVNREQLEKGRRIRKLPGLPHLKTGKAGEYFEELKETIKEAQAAGKYVHTWDGELYLEYHRGTYTSQARNKNWNRRLELLYRDLEFLYSWKSRTENVEYPASAINDGWKIILRNQFHDIIPGSSIREVYEDSEVEYSEALDLAMELRQTLNDSSLPTDDQWTLVNSAAWDRSELVFLTTDGRTGTFSDEEGRTLKASQKDDGYDVFVESVPALGMKKIAFTEEKEEKSDSDVFYSHENGIDTPHYNIEWNEKGHLISVYDVEADREVLRKGGRGNVFQLFEDKPMNFDAWDIDIYYQEKMVELEADSIILEESNGLSASVSFNFTFGNSAIKQTMIVYKHSKRIDFKTVVDWKERQQLLKTAFELDIRTTEATYDIQYGNVKRPTHWNTSWDWARFESVGHQWANLSETNYGVSLLNNNKYGYDIKDGVMRLSLLKGGIYPDPEADIGEHEMLYSLLPHTGSLVESDTVTEAWAINSPLRIFEGDAGDVDQLFAVESDYPLMIDAVKKAEAEEGLIVRLHDHTGGKQKVTLHPQFNYSTWTETNLMEEKAGDVFEKAEEGITLSLEPFEVKTILIK